MLIRHGDDPPDDRVVTYLHSAGFHCDIRRPCLGEKLGKFDDDIAGTVVYGGPYNADDSKNHAFLSEEYRWIDAAIKSNTPLLGICQGAQMIAHHLGAWAGDNGSGKHEFGLYQITPSSEAEDFMKAPLHLVQWHFHTFDLPESAVRLAGNENFPNQAFRVGDTIYGLQFHAEVTIEGFRRWQDGRAHIYDIPGVQSRSEQDALLQKHDKAQADWFYDFLSKLFGKPA